MGVTESAPRTLVVENPDVDVVRVPMTAAVSEAIASHTDANAENVRISNTAYEDQILAKHAKYEEQIKSLELQNEKLRQVKLKELEEAIERVENKFIKATEPLVCAEAQQNVVSCYKSNTPGTLRCAGAVKAFYECTRQYNQALGGY